MSTIHSGPGHLSSPGRCCWIWHWEAVDLWCDDRILPGTTLCAAHYIELVQTVPPVGWSRWNDFKETA